MSPAAPHFAGTPITGAEWSTRYRGSIMNTFGGPQRVLVRGDGCTVWDVDGNRYLDLLGGLAVNALGHAHPKIIEAVSAQLSTLGHISNFFASEPQIRLAERLVGLLELPTGMAGRVFFCNSGTEANEAAFKATRRTGRGRLVVAEGSFHGRTMGSLALTSKAAYREPFEPLPGDVTFVPYGDSVALAAAVDETVAAVVLEPIQGEAGVVVPPADYLAAARSVSSDHGALLWLDEVQTGIGRTGRWFDHQHSPNVVPDLVTVAKGLGGGIPIGACIAVGAAVDLLGPGSHGTTFGGNPVATAAALAVLDEIENGQLMAHAEHVGALFATRLAKHPAVVEVTGRGLMIGVVLGHPIAARVQTAALAAGLIINAPTPERLRLLPPLILSADEAEDAVRTIVTLLDEAMAGGEVL